MDGDKEGGGENTNRTVQVDWCWYLASTYYAYALIPSGGLCIFVVILMITIIMGCTVDCSAEDIRSVHKGALCHLMYCVCFNPTCDSKSISSVLYVLCIFPPPLCAFMHVFVYTFSEFSITDFP